MGSGYCVRISHGKGLESLCRAVWCVILWGCHSRVFYFVCAPWVIRHCNFCRYWVFRSDFCADMVPLPCLACGSGSSIITFGGCAPPVFLAQLLEIKLDVVLGPGNMFVNGSGLNVALAGSSGMMRLLVFMGVCVCDFASIS